MASKKTIIIAFGALAMLLFAACAQVSPTTAPTAFLPATPIGSTQTPLLPSATPTQAVPTPTPEPLAVKVNNEGISLAEYNGELQRLQAALKETGKSMSDDDQKQTVLTELTNQLLSAQAAIQAGYQLSDADFQKRWDDLVAKNGGAQSFADYLSHNAYSEATFRLAMRRSLAAAWQRDQIVAKVATTADQVHARQILVLNEDLANRLYAQLKAGADFATLSLQVDPDTGGEMGWFPKGYLFLPEIEKAAFDLKTGQYSAIIKTTYGYHIVFVIERDANHPLAPDALQKAQQAAFDQWLKDTRSKAQVEVLVK
jgi:peptidyl-prolyl cis-trans isomerase C